MFRKLLSGVLTAAMLVGILPTSALAVHTNEGAGSEGLGSAQIFIDPSPANDEALPPASKLPNYLNTLVSGVGDDIYPYTIQIQEEQTTADFYAEARVQMDSGVADTLAKNDTLDVVKTRFLIFMAVSENIDVDTQTEWLFNSTFLTPDEDVLATYDVDVRRANNKEYSPSYVSETGTAIDMGWVMSGDLRKLIIPNQLQTSAATTTGTFDFVKYFDDEGCYVDDGDGTLKLGDRVNTAFGSVLGITEDNAYPYSHNMNIYAIPVKMNWEAVRDAIADGSIKSNCKNPIEIDENSAAGGSLYADFTAEDFMAPMELTALSDGAPCEGLKMTVDFNSLKPSYRAENSTLVGTRENWFVDGKYLVDQFIPTASDKDEYGTDWIHYVDAIPVSGVIGGAVYAYQNNGESGLILGRYGTDAIDAGTILVQFSLPVTGDIVVEKTIQIQEGVELSDAQISALSDLDDTTLGITVTNADGDEVAEGNTLTLAWNEEAQTLTATGTITGLSSGTTYDVSMDAESTDALEAAGLYLQDDIQVSGGEDIDLTDYYQLTRNEDGTVNTSGLIKEGKVPTVTVTSTYSTEKPVVPTVTLTYDPNGGDGTNVAETYQLNADVTVKSVEDIGFSREGYTFAGWNTAANGSGTPYAASDTFQITENTTLYAQWTRDVVWDSESEVSKTATNLDSTYQSDVTLSLPAADYQKEVDVVFAIDCSSVLESNTEKMAKALYQMAKELIEKDNILLNVGVVGYGHNADVLAELQPVNSENADAFLAALTNEFKNSLMDDSKIDHDGGSNVQVGIRTARKLLDNSTTGTTANNRHLILMTDGAGFWYCRSDADDTSVCTVHNGDRLQPMGNMDISEPSVYGNRQYSYKTGENFGEFIAQNGAAIANSAQYSYSKADCTDENKADEIRSHAYTSADVQSLEKYPYSNMERGTYFAAQELLKAQNSGYKLITIGYPYGNASLAGAAPSAGFLDWTKTISSYYDGSGDIENILGSISNELGQYVDAGSYVIDEIGFGSDYDFTFVNELKNLKLTVGGVELKGTQSGNTYQFGTDEKTDQFVLEYYPDGTEKAGAKYGECFVLKINVPVKLDAPVQLQYSVKLSEPETEAGIYGQYDADGSEKYAGLYTNNSATLFPVDSDGKQDYTPVEFPKPTVSYTVGTITVTPADIVIYTGGEGYESVVTGSGGSEVGIQSKGLPEPGFYIDLPESVNTALLGKVDSDDITEVKVEKDDGTTETKQVIDLSGYLSFTYDDGTNTRTWSLERYDKKTGNHSMAFSRYIYRLVPAENQDPIRLAFKDEKGNLTNSDEFEVVLNDLYKTFAMSIYPGALDLGQVKAVIKTDSEENQFDVAVAKGELIIRGVTDQRTTTTVVNQAPEKEPENITVHVPADTNFYINESKLEVVDAKYVELLVDDLVPDSSNTLVNSAVSKFTDIPRDYDHETKYLDLVDTSNGNVYVTANNEVTVYWPYPAGTDKNTEFHLVHYVGLDRNDNTDLAEGDYKMELYSAEKGNLKNTDQGIKFTVSSFSPFALFWEDDDNGGGGGGGHHDKPEDLNTEDHFAYIIGYPGGTVQPQGDITRAEVATIFFRMLTDEARAENWSQTNNYTDVAPADWYNNAISTLTNMGIISGEPDGSFRPNDPITRAEFTKIAVGFFEEAGNYIEGTFVDVPANAWYADFIDAAVDLGLIEGYPDGTIRPEATITRAEACTIVNRTLGRVPDKDHLLPEEDMVLWPDNSDVNAWYYAQMQEATNSHDYEWTGEGDEQVENWTEKLEDRDWDALETEWSEAGDAPGGEVMD